MPAAFCSCRSRFLTVVQLVDGVPWLIDGQHRIDARKTGPVDNGDQPGLGLRGLRRAERAADERTAWFRSGCGAGSGSRLRIASVVWRRPGEIVVASQRGDGLRACLDRASDRRTPSRRSNGATDSRRVGAAAVVLDWHDIRAAAARAVAEVEQWIAKRHPPRPVGRPPKTEGDENLGRRRLPAKRSSARPRTPTPACTGEIDRERRPRCSIVDREAGAEWRRDPCRSPSLSSSSRSGVPPAAVHHDGLMAAGRILADGIGMSPGARERVRRFGPAP